MGFFSKLFTALRGTTHEVGEAIIDSQALKILEQEMRDARKHLEEARENLARVIAEQMGVEREVKRLQKAVEEYENYAIQALDKNNENLASEIAEKIAELENELEAQKSVLANYDASVKTLKENIRATERNVKSMEREISVIKTTESVQKANTAAAAKFSGSNTALRSATESLERIKAKQQQRADELAATMQLQQEASGGELQEKLRDAGILQNKSSGQSVLERIKAKQSK